MNDRKLLRGTARSFALTLGVLPAVLRDPLSLTYLLARAADTLADTSEAPREERLALLQDLRAALPAGGPCPCPAAPWAARQRREAEAELLRHLPRLWQRLHDAPPSLRARMIEGLDPILEGQIFDLRRFTPAEAGPLRPEELTRYTWWVAGSVGEFWTRLCADLLPRFAVLPAGEMLEPGRLFGQGLQLVNILRDRREDAAVGRIYVREEEVPRWLAAARVWLGSGAIYVGNLRSARLRYATVLPLVLGWHTLSLLQAAPAAAPRVKVPRRQLRLWLVRCLPVLASPRPVARLVRRAASAQASPAA